MIPLDKLSELVPASEAKLASDNAVIEQERGAVARAINQAVNTGEKRVIWQNDLSGRVKSELKQLGYNVSPVPGVALPHSQWLIEWATTNSEGGTV